MNVRGFIFNSALLALCPAIGLAYLTDPPTTADANTVKDCSYWYVATATDTSCATIASENGITLRDFRTIYNPSLNAECKLKAGQSYCVERNFGIPSEPTVTSTPSPSTTAAASNGIVTPLPTQGGLTPNCREFYKPQTGENCASIVTKYGISMAEFYAWNSGVGSTCENMWADTFHCVGIIGQTSRAPSLVPTPTTSTRTPTTTSNGINTPLPTQPGMTPNCDKFYFVKQGETCAGVIRQFSISLNQFYDWNKGVGSDCRDMWAEAYVCVHAFK